MAFVEINWRPARRDLRRFGVVMLAGAAGLAALGQFALSGAGSSAAFVGGAIVGVAGVLALTGTAAGLPLYWAWTGVGFVAGNVVGRALLAVAYYGVFTPIGVAMRLTGHDPLGLRPRTADTYWQDLAPSDRRRDERQF